MAWLCPPPRWKVRVTGGSGLVWPCCCLLCLGGTDTRDGQSPMRTRNRREDSARAGEQRPRVAALCLALTPRHH